MKRVVLVFIVILIICCLVSCKREENESFIQSEDDYYSYIIDEKIRSFDVDNMGRIYYLTDVDSIRYETLVDINGEKFDVAINETKLKVLNADGEQQNSYIVPGMATTLRVGKDKIYVIEREVDDYSLHEYSIENQTSEKVYDFADFTSINQFEVIGDKIYFIGINKKYVNKNYTLSSDEDTYLYSGEVAGCIDIDTGTMTELQIEFPISFSKTVEDNLIIYAHDEGGYYFSEYNTKAGVLQDKTYHDMDMLSRFVVYNEKKDFLFIKYNYSIALTAASLDPNKGEVELVPNFKGGTSLRCQGEYTYSTNIDSTQIVRINNSTYVRGNDMIKMLATDFYKDYTPFGCGYTMEQELITDEEMALALLSQDEGFDICFMNSQQEISENVRDKGSFYPLNEVKGVEDYLNECFPYIREAATNSDGDIWMLPIAIDIPCILYNESLSKDNEIEFTNTMELNTFFDILKEANRNASLSDKIYYSKISLTDAYFYQFLRSNDDFENNTFEKLAEFFKSEVNYSDINIVGNTNIPLNLSLGNDEKFIFIYDDTQKTQFRLSVLNDLRACELPHLTDEKTNIANCFFLCVNPASKNLKETLQYISSLCSYLTTRNDMLMFVDRSRYPQLTAINDLYQIYSNGDVQFTYPNELFKNDFNRYLMDEMDLKTLVTEANHKLEIFLKE